MKIYMRPNLTQVTPDSGIGQVVLAMHEYLPKYGVEFVSDMEQADLVAAHVSSEGLPHCEIIFSHGVYFSDIDHSPYTNTNHEINARIAASVRRALAVTVPSEWVSRFLKRDCRIVPNVIWHGIDVNKWSVNNKSKEPFVLFNKGRDRDVCNPLPAYELARRGVQVVSTFSPRDKAVPDAMRVIGALPFEKMKQIIEQSTIYLATTMETFGIGTLEALAAGCPVLGYDWGGTAEIVEHGVSGILVEPNNLDALTAGLQTIIDNWQAMSAAARARAELFTWDAVMAQYAALFQDTYAGRKAERDRVSIIITNHNYGRWVGDAIESVLGQLQAGDELIVIDDGSTDNSREIISESESAYSGQKKAHVTFRSIFTENHGVAHARNLGISLARNPFIGCLDADDKYHPNFLRVTRPALASDRGIGVAYVGLEFYNEAGTQTRTWHPDPKFDWEYQSRYVAPPTPPSTMIPTPSACLFRKAMWERAGGYKQMYRPAEDTEFMMRGLSVGFTAYPIQTDALTYYREHAGGASKPKPDNPYPYSKSIYTWHPWIRDRLFPFAAPAETSLPVNSYALPLVSVIIPVAEKHIEYLPSALDSLLGQTFRQWEAVVVTDNCDLPAAILTVYPFIDHYASNGKGVSEARNTSLEHVRAPLVLFLDADDWLDPHAIDKLVLKYSQSNGRYVYPDALGVFGDGRTESIQFLDYDPRSYFQVNLHSVTALMETAQAKTLQFSPHMRGYEDWDFYLRAAIAGYHGVRLEQPLVNIRRDTGHFQDVQTGERQKYRDEYIAKHYQEFQTGVKPMASCCGGGGDAVIRAKAAVSGEMQQVVNVSGNELVRMEYTGAKVGAFTININSKGYRMSASPLHRIFDARPGDVQQLLNTVEGLRVVRNPGVLQTPAPSVPEPVKLNWAGTFESAVKDSLSGGAVPYIETPAPERKYAPEVERAHQAPVTPAPVLDKPPQIAIEAAFQDDYQVVNMTISDVKDAIANGTDSITLFGWLQAEQQAEKPRTGVIAAIEKALER